MTSMGKAGLRRFAKKVFLALEQLLYPLKCFKCGAYIDPDIFDKSSVEAFFCDQCMLAGFFPVHPPFCIRCGAAFSGKGNENYLCEACFKAPLELECVRAATEYKGIMKDAVPLFKYRSKLSLARFFEYLLFQAFLQYYADDDIDLIMPVPLYRKKLRQRGFNQSYLLVRGFKKFYVQKFNHIPLWKIDTDSLIRCKATKPQTGFDFQQRKVNLENAFKVVCPENIEARHILLVDDVFTTGSTCNEAAMELLKNGARKVSALVLARA